MVDLCFLILGPPTKSRSSCIAGNHLISRKTAPASVKETEKMLLHSQQPRDGMLLFQEYCDLVNWLHLHFCKDVVRGVINLILTSNQTFSIVEMLRKI
jgi:hypothetical protein